MNNTGHDSLFRRVLRKNIFLAAALPSCVSTITPANGSTLPASTGSAALTWTAAVNATSYDVYIWSGPYPSLTPIANVPATSYTANNLAASSAYTWYIVPKNANGSAGGCDAANKSTFTTAAVSAGPGSGLQGVYYNGLSLAGAPLLTRVDPTINFAFTYSTVLSPAPGIVPPDAYSVRWTGQVKAMYSENYTFYTLSDDGIRLWVNGVQLVDDWVNQGATERSGTIALVAGQKYDIVIEYYEATGEAFTKLSWSGPSTPKAVVPQSQLYPPVFTESPGTGLQGVYYNGQVLAGAPLLTRIDPTINLALTYATVLSPAPGIVPSDAYSVRWTGQVKAMYSENYTFYTLSDDGIRLWVNGVQLVDNWVNQGATERSGTIALVAGQKYDIVIEYYEATGEAFTKLSWSSPSTPKAVVPQANLFPPGAAARFAETGTITSPINTGLAATDFTLTVYPNPVKQAEMARLNIHSDKPRIVTVSIVNSNGAVVHTKKINLVPGLNTSTINMFSLARGLYIIHIAGGSKPLKQKLLVE